MTEEEKVAVRLAALERVVACLWVSSSQQTKLNSMQRLKRLRDNPPPSIPDHWKSDFRHFLEAFIDSFEDPDLILAE